MKTSNGLSNVGSEIDVIVPVRMSMYHHLPKVAWLQWVITVITGCPHEGQQPIFRKSHWWCFGLAIGMVWGGFFLNLYIISASGPVLCLLPVGWLLVVGGSRALQTSIVHACVHAQFTGKRAVDMVIAEAITVFLGIMNAAAYMQGHCGVHHAPAKVATIDDDDLAFLLVLGFRPGMTKADLWRHFWQILVSLRFHYMFLHARFRSNFVNARPWRIVTAVGWWVAVGTIVYLTDTWLAFALAWLLPVTLFYHVAALSQFLSEHLWLHATNERGTVEHLSKKEQMQRSKLISPARFFGEAVPVAGAGGMQWLAWWFRLLFVHLPLRIAVIPTPDLVWHPVHHSKTHSDWRNADFEGPTWAVAKPDEFIPIWGLGKAIDLVFNNMSQKLPIKSELHQSALTDSLMGM